MSERSGRGVQGTQHTSDYNRLGPGTPANMDPRAPPQRVLTRQMELLSLLSSQSTTPRQQTATGRLAARQLSSTSSVEEHMTLSRLHSGLQQSPMRGETTLSRAFSQPHSPPCREGTSWHPPTWQQLPLPSRAITPGQSPPSPLKERADWVGLASVQPVSSPPGQTAQNVITRYQEPRPGNILPRPASQHSNIATSPPAPPSAELIAIFLAIYEPPELFPLSRRARISRRNCSIMVEYKPDVDRFSEFCCLSTPLRRPLRHLQFFSTHNLPDPRRNAPGLIAMDFIACVSKGEASRLEDWMMKKMRRTMAEDWDQNTWIAVYLQDLVHRKLITQQRMLHVLEYKQRALKTQFTGVLPNARRCFPDANLSNSNSSQSGWAL